MKLTHGLRGDGYLSYFYALARISKKLASKSQDEIAASVVVGCGVFLASDFHGLSSPS
jgi:hypothetical protein